MDEISVDAGGTSETGVIRIVNLVIGSAVSRLPLKFGGGANKGVLLKPDQFWPRVLFDKALRRSVGVGAPISIEQRYPPIPGSILQALAFGRGEGCGLGGLVDDRFAETGIAFRIKNSLCATPDRGISLPPSLSQRASQQ